MQINNDEPKRRGRPKKEGEIKQASVRIRPSLQRQLQIAADQSGRSVAAELESRLASAFDEAAMSAATKALLDKIAGAINEVEAVAGKGVSWDKSLRSWAMVREVLANGPILEKVPHPDPSKVKDMEDKRSALIALQVERRTLAGSLRAMGIRADTHTSSGPSSSLGGILMAALESSLHEPTASDAHGAIDERTDLPDDARSLLHDQVDRLVELDREIDKIRDGLKDAITPYVEARLAAREFIYGVNGPPDLPDWLTAPVGLDETPIRKGPLGAAKR